MAVGTLEKKEEEDTMVKVDKNTTNCRHDVAVESGTSHLQQQQR